MHILLLEVIYTLSGKAENNSEGCYIVCYDNSFFITTSHQGIYTISSSTKFHITAGTVAVGEEKRYMFSIEAIHKTPDAN